MCKQHEIRHAICTKVNLQGDLEDLASLGGQMCRSRQELWWGSSPRPSEKTARYVSSESGIGDR